MSTLWYSADEPAWHSMLLSLTPGRKVYLSPASLLPLGAGCGKRQHGLCLLAARSRPVREVLLVPPRFQGSLQINGAPPGSGLAAIGDRDCISLGKASIYYSRESLARVEPYAGEAVCCARCKLDVAVGCAVVACPSCSAVHHQFEDSPCWTHGATCTLCDQRSDLENPRYRWTPNEL